MIVFIPVDFKGIVVDKFQGLIATQAILIFLVIVELESQGKDDIIFII